MGAGSTASERSRCRSCEIMLVRNPDFAGCPWQVDRDDKSTEQCRARLQALAKAQGFDFEDASESSPGIWRCHLYEKERTKEGARVAPINGSGPSAEDALQEAVYEAEVKDLI